MKHGTRRIFLDTEFLNRGADHPISLISIGMVDDAGKTYYGINRHAPLAAMWRSVWIRENLWDTLPLSTAVGALGGSVIDWDDTHPDIVYLRDPTVLRQEVYDFITGDDQTPELWGSFPAFDMVLLSQMYGTFDDTPTGLPMRMQDIQDLIDITDPSSVSAARAAVPLRPAHHALNDALEIKEILEELLHAWENGLKRVKKTVVPDEYLGWAGMVDNEESS